MEHEVILSDDQLRTLDFVFTLFENNIPDKIKMGGLSNDTMAKFELLFKKVHTLGKFFDTILKEDGKGEEDETKL